ncbi:hypothetical protein [Phytohabitans houttuyneae]|uniref:Uncharacterized protein n=1 Tax=Phytohabitans houttuyneae TaxID=1076126 RepID=A0A6V8KNS4_9ACTN|nr:hypothetical protein [Phytohabitans houttuyneae]GFJ83829.1 hypothetical protein Phou_080090 [Phytohabitans houttuyneae]
MSDYRAMPVLELSIDLGVRPSMVELAKQTQAIVQLWEFSRSVVMSMPVFPEQWHEPTARRLTAVPHPRWVQYGDDDWPGPEVLCIRQMSIASPWEVFLTVAAERAAPLMYGGAVLVGLERIIRLVMDWQVHRQQLQQARNSAAPSGQLVSEPGDRRQEPDLAQILSAFVARHNAQEGAPAEQIDVALSAIDVLKAHPIQRVRLQQPED